MPYRLQFDTMSIMIYLYARASSVTQSTDSQLPELRQWAGDREYLVYEDIFTGTTMDRPGWSAVASRIQKGDTVVIWRLDRLGRTASGLTRLFDDLVQRGINLVSIKDGIDLNTPAGRLIANVLASMAQFETEMRRQRAEAGIAAAKAKGVKWKGTKKGRITSLSADPAQIRAIKLMKEQGFGPAEIAKGTGLSRPTIYKYLKSG